MKREPAIKEVQSQKQVNGRERERWEARKWERVCKNGNRNLKGGCNSNVKLDPDLRLSWKSAKDILC